MPVWNRLATWKPSVAPRHGGLAVAMDGVGSGVIQVAIEQGALPDPLMPGTLLAMAVQQAGVPLPRVWFHVNRDGSIALATGRYPLAWPEDAPGTGPE